MADVARSICEELGVPFPPITTNDDSNPIAPSASVAQALPPAKS
jgi:hypothetical protein